MNHTNDDRCESGREKLEIEQLLTEDERDPGDFNPPSRKKDKDLNRTLSILDEIESNKEGGKK